MIIVSILYALMWFGILVLIVAIAIVYYFYNRLQGPSHFVREAFSNVLVCMKKRVDLVNKLIDITSGYGEHEKLIHIAVSQNQNAVNSFKESEVALSQVIEIAQSFPELRANQIYQQLMTRLEAIEADLQNKREIYNSVVKMYNTNRSSFPTVLVAGSLGFKEAPYFNIEDADTLNNLKDFQTDDGTMLKEVLATVGKKVVATSKILGNEAKKMSEDVLNKTSHSYSSNKKTQPSFENNYQKTRSFCSQCGVKMEENSKFCNLCGNKL